MKETREMKFFKDTLEELAIQQMIKRDEVLDSIKSSELKKAKDKLEELQTISVGLQICQQTIMRDADRAAAEDQRNKVTEALKLVPPSAAKEEAPKKVSALSKWFKR